MDFPQLGNYAAQAAVKGGMRTTSTMQRPSDDAANARARAKRGKKKNRGNNGQLSAQDMIALFQSMPMPNRGFKTQGGDKPDLMGGSLDDFYKKNPGIAQGAARADQIAQERQQQLSRGFDAGRAAVDFTKQTKGYTGADGVFVPPTMPATPSSAYGTGSVSFTDKPTRGTMTDPATGQKVFMDQYLPNQSRVQDPKFGPMPGQEDGGALARPRVQQQPQTLPLPAPSAPARTPASDMESLFPGGSSGPKQGTAASPAPVGGDFWAWEAANREPSALGTTNPNEIQLTDPMNPVAPYNPAQSVPNIMEVLLNLLGNKNPVTSSSQRGKQPFSFPPM